MPRSERLEYVRCSGDITATTGKAILFAPNGVDTDKLWIPRSCLSISDADVGENDNVTIQVVQWFAKREGLD